MAAILADDNFMYILLNENDRIPIRISLKFVPKGTINFKPALVQVMAWEPNRQQAITWTNADLVYWCIYVALGGDELTGTYVIQPCWPFWTMWNDHNMFEIFNGSNYFE